MAALALLVILPGTSTAQSSAFKIRVDAVLRQEWTLDVWRSKDETEDENRRLTLIRPRLELNLKNVLLAVGADLNYSSDKNYNPAPETIRDNYKSRDVRLDLAFGALKLGIFRAYAGRFPMPVRLTEMIWDTDLRPQGGSIGLELNGKQGAPSPFRITGLFAQGSHVFKDEKTQMYLGSAGLNLPVGRTSRLDLSGSYVQFARLDALDPMLLRQNSRLGEDQVGALTHPLPLANDYRIVDLVARLDGGGESVPWQFVADYCWNTAVDKHNRGLWLALAIGSIVDSRGRVEYTYARVDRDATVAAYTTDDFLWGTGWEGHRGDLGFRTTNTSSIHGIFQYQRFKDSAVADEADHWVTRYRLEARIYY